MGGDHLQGDARLTSSFREVKHGGGGGGGGGRGKGFRGILLEENGADGLACKHVLQNVKDGDGGGVGGARTRGRCEDLNDVLFEAASDDNAPDTAVDSV